ncbi:Taurine import ATP-binding protein TauB [Achromobacter xylosoxidans]|nr:Taurine import ATP-binding protein TauB [Achromobacter xylosoxidans]
MSSVSVPKLRVRGISKHFHGDQGSVQVLDDIGLDAASGEFVSIIGPSGCGKSTLFNILTGLLEPDSGSIALDGKPVADLRGRVGYMLQRDLLMPWRTVLDNVIVGLEVRGTPRAESVERAREYLHTFGLL